VNKVGAKVREIRMSKGLTQEQLSARCNIDSWVVSRCTIAKIEAGHRRVIDVEISILAKALKVKEQALFDNLN
jgi:transcriptional regulator with XRE-family HTH domain